MRTFGLLSGVDLGPWRLPQKAQTALIQTYAAHNGLAIDQLVSEFFFARGCPHLILAVTRDPAPARIIFATGYQLPRDTGARATLLASLAGCHFAFVLEGESFQLPSGPGELPTAVTSFLAELDYLLSAPTLSPANVRALFPVPHGEDDASA